MSCFFISYSTLTSRVTVHYSSGGDTDQPRFMLCLPSDELMLLLAELRELYDDWDYERKPHESLPSFSDSDFHFYFNEDPSGFPPSGRTADEYIDEDARRLLDEIHDRLIQLRRRGLSSRTICECLLERQKPSRLCITHDYRLLLSDYGNLEVKLTPLPKALYLLFLRHPEGIAFKEMACHAAELSAIYAQLSPSINPQRREQQIRSLTDPLSNSLNEKVSLIHRAFATVLDDSLLPFYVIDGPKGSQRTVRLPRSLLIL